MQEKDLTLLWMFTLRIGMYTGIENKDTVSVFLHGYEIGRNQECNFIEQIVKSIKLEYDIEKRATGWIGQIERLAAVEEADWITIFKRQSLKILNAKFSKEIQQEFTESLKKRINGKMLGVNDYFRKDWITDWYGIIQLEENWFKEIWSNEELKLMKEIESELKSLGKVNRIENNISPSQKLKDICAKLYNKMNQEEENES